ncbi:MULTISPECIES: restriction endonuclease [Acinetobacter]|uniref:restriction endonuclease n=1 Tax=Acinetobacter calcoaceticus TaxID=471 RepID=UPI001D189938|nr:restriction endonuclease [Acinetobacter calcoaceticus]
MFHIPNVWGIHMGVHVGTQPIEQNYIGIGWSELGDLSQIKADREAFKVALQVEQPDASMPSIRTQVATIYRFMHVVKAGDYVVYPCKSDRLVYIGIVTGEYERASSDDEDAYLNRRPVKWLTPNGIPRNNFSQVALYEIGAYITLFEIRKTAGDFLNAVGIEYQGLSSNNPVIELEEQELEQEEIPDDETVTKVINETAKYSTEDFIIRRLHQNLNGYQFEEFVAHLLECMGYVARVTQRSGDGGVDIIAHKDTLGFEPPIIKVQCKKTLTSNGLPEINQLLGTLGDGEYALFVNLGSYSNQAKNKSTNKSQLRLIDGKEIVELIYRYYEAFKPQYRALIPLKQVFVPDVGD